MTTIALDATIHRRLLQLKKDWGSPSLNEVVARLIERTSAVPASMFGVDPTLPRLTRQRRDEMWA